MEEVKSVQARSMLSAQSADNKRPNNSLSSEAINIDLSKIKKDNPNTISNKTQNSVNLGSNQIVNIIASSIQPNVNSNSSSIRDVYQVSKALESALNAKNQEVQFNVDVDDSPGTNINFRVVNRDTGEVIREFPSEEVGKIAEKALSNMEQGLLFDKTA